MERPARGRHRLHMVLLIVPLALVLLAMTALIIWSVYTPTRLQRAIAEAAEAGVPLTHEAFRAKWGEIPDTENAASWYLKAFDLMHAPDTDEISNIMDDEAWPHGQEDLPLAQDYMDRIMTLLDDKTDVLDILRTARDFEKACYNVAIDESELLLPHLSQARWCGRLLLLAMLAAVHEGRADEAVGYALDGLALSRSLSGEPLIVQSLVAIATLHTVVEWPLSAALGSPEAGESKLAAIQHALFEYSRDFSLRAAIEGELVQQFTQYDTLVTGILEESSGTGWARLLGTGYIRADMARVIEHYIEFLSDLERPASEINAIWEKRLAAIEESYWLMVKMIAPSHSRIQAQGENARARMQAAALSVAALRFYRREGRWPDDLDVLTPDYIMEMPSDPFSGRPFIYRILDDGIIIYSVGTNGIDDGGRPHLMATSEQERRDCDYDDVGFRLRLP